jgi:hypothetical protein
MDENELPKKLVLTNPWRSTRTWPTKIKMDWQGRGRQGNWILEIGWQMPRIGVAGDICLRKPSPTQDFRADDDGTDPLVLPGSWGLDVHLAWLAIADACGVLMENPS